MSGHKSALLLSRVTWCTNPHNRVHISGNLNI